MTDINKPKEFLTELLQTVDALDAGKAQYKELEKNSKDLLNSSKSMMKAIEREKNDTVSSRRNDLEAGFNKQLKTINSELKTVQDKRQKALNAAMDKKAKEATSGVRKENEDYKDALKLYVKSHKLPGILKSRTYYSLFCPNPLFYVLYVVLFAAVLIFAGVNIRAAFAEGKNAVPFLIIFALDIVLLFAYVLIWSNTRVKYRDEIKNCLNIIKSIKSNEKSVRKIEKGIKQGGDNYPEELGGFDEDIAGKKQKALEIEQNKKKALDNFDAVTAVELKAEIDKKHEIDKNELDAKIAANDSEMKAVKDSMDEAESRLNTDFVSYVGTRNLDHDRITQMISLLDNGTVKSVTEAVSALDNAGTK